MRADRGPIQRQSSKTVVSLCLPRRAFRKLFVGCGFPRPFAVGLLLIFLLCHKNSMLYRPCSMAPNTKSSFHTRRFEKNNPRAREITRIIGLSAGLLSIYVDSSPVTKRAQFRWLSSDLSAFYIAGFFKTRNRWAFVHRAAIIALYINYVNRFLTCTKRKTKRP